MRIEGKHTFLETITTVDTDCIVRWRNQQFVRENFIYQELFTPASHKRWLRDVVETRKAEQFIIYVKSEKRAVGTVYLRDIDLQNEKAEYGIFIGEKGWLGKGIGSEAAMLMTEYGFDVLKLHKIMLRVLATNKRAIGSYEKAGFEKEGYLKDEVKIGGQYRDIVLMAKWNKQNGVSYDNKE